MISNLDIDRSTRVLILEHREGSALEGAKRIDESLVDIDVDRYLVWKWNQWA